MKNYFNFSAILFSSLLASVGMILMKIAMQNEINLYILSISIIVYSFAVLLFLYLLSKLKYIIIMSSLSLPYIFSYILSVIYLDESFSIGKNIAVIFIIMGMTMITVTSRRKK